MAERDCPCRQWISTLGRRNTCTPPLRSGAGAVVASGSQGGGTVKGEAGLGEQGLHRKDMAAGRWSSILVDGRSRASIYDTRSAAPVQPMNHVQPCLAGDECVKVWRQWNGRQRPSPVGAHRQ
jgi:hypothetical protein